MSVFKVQLNNVQQGLLDLDPTTNPLAAGQQEVYGDLGTQFSVSKQRQIYVAGPNRRYRLLVDGATFTDCNYWKQFAYPQTTWDKAFISVVTDDGSVYNSTDPTQNVALQGNTVTLTTTLSDTVIDFVTTYGGPASFLSVQNLDTTAGHNVIGELNGNTNVTFLVGPGDTMMFNQGDMVITLLRLKASNNGSQASWIASVQSTCTS